MPSDQHSVTPLYAQALLQSAERHGVALPAQLCQRLRSGERIPLALQDELWESYCALMADPLVGLRLGLDIQIGHLDSAGMLLVTCDTLGEALAELVEYAPVIGAGGEFQLLREADQVAIDYEPHLAVRQAERVEAALTVLLNLTRWATGGRFQPSGIWLAHAPLALATEYQALIDCPLHFSAGCNRITFSVEQLGLSGRHLNRKLAEEGLSFKALRESVLQQMACSALQGRQSVAQIAEQLGFSDENAFVRAFRRWQGETPARYKAALAR